MATLKLYKMKKAYNVLRYVTQVCRWRKFVINANRVWACVVAGFNNYFLAAEQFA